MYQCKSMIIDGSLLIIIRTVVKPSIIEENRNDRESTFFRRKSTSCVCEKAGFPGCWFGVRFCVGGVVFDVDVTLFGHRWTVPFMTVLVVIANYCRCCFFVVDLV